jgi:peptidoglycan/LPS O-acetylase OafA/YrhL
MSTSPTLVPSTPAQALAPQRDLYIDRLRTLMTVLVVLHHTAITYGASGGWFYHELNPSPMLSSLLLTLFVATNQAYFMGFFFFLAGYFTPRSLERKGYAWFIGDRFLRLGLPLLAFILILGPATAAMVTASEGRGFWPTIVWIWRHGEIITGPLWFVQALLMFILAYCGWRAALRKPLACTERTPRPVPAWRWWLVSAIAVGAAALTIRQFVPVGKNVIGLQLGYFASYIFLFAVGIAAWRYDWLRQLTWKNVRPWVISLCIAWLGLPIAIVIAVSQHTAHRADFSGGLSWAAIFYAFWDPFVAWGLIGAWLLVFRERMNRPPAFWAWLNRRAYTVYIIHPLLVVGLALLLRPWHAPALVKFAALGSLACIASWFAADPFVRLPGFRRVV